MSLEDRLESLERRLQEIEAEWSRPEVAGDQERARQLGREQAQLAPVVDDYRRLRAVREQLEAARRDRTHETDPETREMAAEIVGELESRGDTADRVASRPPVCRATQMTIAT